MSNNAIAYWGVSGDMSERMTMIIRSDMNFLPATNGLVRDLFLCDIDISLTADSHTRLDKEKKFFAETFTKPTQKKTEKGSKKKSVSDNFYPPFFLYS